jgi:hypothetical protein
LENLIAQGEFVLLTLYANAMADNLTGAMLKEIRRVLEAQTASLLPVGNQ